MVIDQGRVIGIGVLQCDPDRADPAFEAQLQKHKDLLIRRARQMVESGQIDPDNPPLGAYDLLIPSRAFDEN
jgi:hypothetical protein